MIPSMMKFTDYISLIAAVITIVTFLVQVTAPPGTPPVPIDAPTARTGSNSPPPATGQGALQEKVGLLVGAIVGVGTVVGTAIARGLEFLFKVAIVALVGLVPARLAYRAFRPRIKYLMDGPDINRWVFWSRARAAAVYVPIFGLAFAIMFPTARVSELFWEGIRHLAELK